VIRTPGHSPGHICLYEPRKRLLFSGDHVLYDVTPHVGFHPQSGDNPLGDYISSLKRVQNLNVSFVLPGHGPIFNSLKLRVAEILYHHEQRMRNIMRALKDGLKTAYQIAEEIPWMTDQGSVAFRDLTSWDRRLAVMETMAHLKLLVAEGKVGDVDMDGVSLYLTKD
jgi:glyoxylase-like metal-dependent hydrolase (beta-lactamase superfamily II)